jgi:HSP20 family protein
MWLSRWDDYLWNDIADIMNTLNQVVRNRSEYPAFRMYENDDGYLLMTEVPGINPEDIQIELNDNVLTINVEKKPEKNENLTVLRNEIEYGKFVRSFQLPFKVKEEEIEAEYKYGVLKILLPKAEEEKPKKIAIKSA